MTHKKTNKPNNGWTEERRKRQSELIRQWQPWTASTGAKTEVGKQISSRNAFKGGYWREERMLQKQINTTLKAQKELMERIKEERVVRLNNLNREADMDSQKFDSNLNCQVPNQNELPPGCI